MKNFKDFVTEESEAYEKAYHKHTAEMKSLNSNGYGMFGRNAPKNSKQGHAQMRYVTKGADEHHMYIMFQHNLNTRKNTGVHTQHVYVKDGIYAGEHFSPKYQTVDRKKHSSISAAIKYMNKRVADIKK